MEALLLLLFILPGFYALISEIVLTKKIRRIGADYWIFLSLVCLLSSLSIFLSEVSISVVTNLVDFIRTQNTGFDNVVQFLIKYLIEPLKLSSSYTQSVFQLTIFDYFVSFFIAKKVIGTKFCSKFIEYINGTEAIDKFLEELLLNKKNNTAIVTLDTGKVFIGPIIDGDIHKDIKNDSITIRPLLSGYKNNGQLVISTTNLTISMNTDGDIELNPIYSDLKNNIQLSKVSYVSKFVLVAFAKYVAKGDITFQQSNGQARGLFLYINQFSEKLGLSKDK